MNNGTLKQKNTNAVILFSKAPVVHRVGKGDPFSGFPWTDFDSLFSAMFDDLIEQCSKLSSTDILVFRDQTEFSDDFLKHFVKSVSCFDVQGTTVAEQVHNAVEHAAGLGYGRVIVILENNPLIDASFLKRLFDQLQYEEDCVILGPSTEGNFYLVGMKNNQSPIFLFNDDWTAAAGGILKRACATDSLLFLSSQLYSLNSGINLHRLRNEIDDRAAHSSDFPHRTHATFSAFEKKYKIKKTKQ